MADKVKKSKRRSMSLIRQINNQIDIDKLEEIEKTRNEWQTAVSEELKQLNDHIDIIEDRINTLETQETSELLLNTSRANKGDANMQDQVDALAELIDAMKSERLKDRAMHEQQINALGSRITLLEKENDVLIEKNVKLHNEIDNLNEIINGEENTARTKEILENKIDQMAENCNQEINIIKAQIESLGAQAGNINKHNNVNTKDTGHKIKLNVPIFKGIDNERPVKFLTELKRYITATKPDENEFKCILTQALQESARNWYFINDNDIHDYDGFEVLFKERYWNTNIQRNVNRKIEYGQYYENSKMTRTEYATHIYGFAKELDNNITENELAVKISQHFQRNVRYAFNGQSIKDKNTLFKILMDFDNDEKREKQNQFAKQKTNYGENKFQENNRQSNLHINNGSAKNDSHINITNQRKPYTDNRNTNITTQNKQWQPRNVNLLHANKLQTRNITQNTQNKQSWIQKNPQNKMYKQAKQSHEQIDVLNLNSEEEQFKNQASGSGNGK